MTRSRTAPLRRLQAIALLFAWLAVLSTASARAIHGCPTGHGCCVEASTPEPGTVFLDACLRSQIRHGVLCRTLPATPAAAIGASFDPNPPAAAAFAVVKRDAPLLAASLPSDLRIPLLRLPSFIVFGNFRS